AAQEVVPVAVGPAEAVWVEKAAITPVRVLAKEVARATDPHADESLFRMVAGIEPEHRAVLDEALRIEGRLDPHASQARRYEAIAIEYLGEFPAAADEIREGPVTEDSWREDRRLLGGAFKHVGPRAELEDRRAAALEAETDAWTHLPPAVPRPAPAVDLAFVPSMKAKALDRELRRLVRQDQGWADIAAHRACAIKLSRMYLTLGYATFKQYVEERLQLPYRWVADRVKLEEKLWKSPALQEARRQKVGVERLRLLSLLPEKEIAPSIARAKAMTVIALRRELDRAEEARMRGLRKVKALVPRSVAYLLAAAMATARAQANRPLSDGECLAIIAAHFVRTYEDVARRRLSNSQRVRERDGGWCTVPGCSAHSDDAHHITFRSRGGHRTAMWNQTGDCRFHHVCVHDFGLRLVGKAPDALVWTLDGEPFTGR
ncbi:MAG TPA: HNH endonuclease, partial [Myxococcaceae bacterium]|nr:HNH endonuclease [Myxococcaceae bacterium]